VTALAVHKPCGEAFGQRRIDVLELLRIVDALKGNPRRVFGDILKRHELKFGSRCSRCDYC
jgi:hypothetical protein